MVAFAALPLLASAANVYIAQSAAGAGTGADCADALAMTYLNTAANWVAGNTYHLCGTINGSAGSTSITVLASGTSSNPITLLFEMGASIQAPYFNSSGAINVNGKSYIVINGGSNGFIEATSNGTSGSSACPSGSCSNQQNSVGVYNLGSNSTLENLGIYDMYMHESTSDEAFDSLTVNCVDVSEQGLPSNVTVTGITAHDCLTGVEFWWSGNGGSNYTVSNNTIYNTCWGMDVIEGGNGNTYSDIYIFGNHVYGHSNWADTSAACHGNGMHLFQANACSSCVVNGIYIYNNEWDGPIDAVDTTSQIYVDNNGGNAAFTNGYIFNNVFSWANGDCSGSCGNGQLGLYSGSGWLVANNTFIGNATSTSSAQGFLLNDNQSGVTLIDENNLLTRGVSESYFDTGLNLTGSPNYDIYANSPSSSQVFECNSNQYSASQFSSWVTCIGNGNEASSNYYATDPLPTCNSNTDCSNVEPASGSTAIGAAANLYSVCNGQPNPGLGALCFDKHGNPRPNSSSGPWDAGAYIGVTSTPPAPASGLVASPH